MKIIQIGKSILQFLIGTLLLFIGMLCIRLAEPLYGIAIILIGLSLFPFFWRILDRFFSLRPSRPLKIGFSLALLILVFSGLALQGRSGYDRSENINASALDSLSVHPVKKQVVNGLDYYYIDAGSGEAVFLLHGFPDMATTWDETITELSKEHRVIAPFLRGYYPTGIPSDGDYAVKTIAGDIVALADRLGIDEFNVVGQDWGASISYSVANLAPKRVKRVAAIAIPHASCFELSPSLIWAGRHFILFSFESYAVRYTRKRNFAYIDRLYRRWSPDFEAYGESSSAIKETFKYPGRLEAALGYYWSFKHEQGDEARAAFYAQRPKMPVLYLGGEHDPGVTPESIDCHEAHMASGSRAVVFKNAGHFLHHEVPDQFLGELKGFFQTDF